MEVAMAIARCETCGRPQGLKQDYSYFHSLASSVSKNIFCGSQACGKRGFIWLTDEEEKQYLCGQRSFRLPNQAVHVQVT